MPATLTCPKCSGVLPSDAPGGICPQCLLLAGLDGNQSPLPQDNWSPFAVTTPQPGGFLPPAPESLAAQFPQLEILELLGQGGMGAVYKARQTKLDRLVALKVIRPESAADPAFAERFNREARTLARLSHPHIVSVHDFGEANITDEATGQPRTLYYFVMEYIDGVNLRQLMQSGALQPDQTLGIIPQICDALQFAHDEGVVHRDIKPENILIDRRGRVKIADFGLAKLATGSEQDFTLTATHQVMGTPRYMAPEQMEGSHGVDHRADIYSLGVVFYEMLTGQVPAGHFERPSRKSAIDARLDDVILKALARDPGGRFQRASELKSNVEAIALPQFSTVGSLASGTGSDSGTAYRPGLSTVAGGQVVGAWRWMTGDVALERGAQRESVTFPSFLMVVLAVQGCLFVLAPWFELHFPLEAEVSGHPIAEPITQTTSGIEVVPGGILLTSVFAVLVLFLLITPTQHAPRLWRSILMTVLSFVALALTLSLKTNANLQMVKLPAATFTHRLSDNLGNVEHDTTYCWGFMGTVGCSWILLVLSASAVRHACTGTAVAEGVSPQTNVPVLTPARRNQGTPLADYRFRVSESCNALQQARFHFGSLGYELIRQEPDECVFERGSKWGGALETDIRRYQTWLTVLVSPPDSAGRLVACSWSVRLLGAWVGKRDTNALRAEGEQFAAFLGAAVTGVDGSSNPPTAPSQMGPVARPAPNNTATNLSGVSSDPLASSEFDLAQVRSDVDGPSLALIVFGMLMLIGHTITTVVFFNAPRDAEVAWIAIPGAVVGLGMFLGGLGLRNFRSRGWAQLGAIAAHIPVSVVWPLTMFIGIWVWKVLGKPHVRHAFVETAQQRQNATNLSVAPGDSLASSEFDLAQVRNDVDGPSLALSVFGVLMVSGHIAVTVLFLGNTLMRNEMIWLICVPGVLIGLGMLMGGLSLRSFRSRGWAQLGAIAALIPFSFGWPITIAIGIWSWKVLGKPGVQRAFVAAALRRGLAL